MNTYSISLLVKSDREAFFLEHKGEFIPRKAEQGEAEVRGIARQLTETTDHE